MMLTGGHQFEEGGDTARLDLHFLLIDLLSS